MLELVGLRGHELVVELLDELGLLHALLKLLLGGLELVGELEVLALEQLRVLPVLLQLQQLLVDHVPHFRAPHFLLQVQLQLEQRLLEPAHFAS